MKKLLSALLISLCALTVIDCNTSTNTSVTGGESSVNPPVFSLMSGRYSSDQSVMISCMTKEAAIYYTTDGSVPTSSSNKFSTPLSVAGNGTSMTINAVAVKADMTDSAVVTAVYEIDYSRVSTPNFSLA
jgi:hypothetical protein